MTQGFRLTRERTVAGKTTVEVASGITTLTGGRGTAKALLTLVRDHWTIENSLHYVWDVTLREDACRVRSGSAPQVLAAVRNAVVHLLSGVAAKSRPEAVVENIIEGHKVASWGHEEPGFLLTCAECGRVLINPSSADWEDVAFVRRWASTEADEKPPRARPPQSHTNSRKV